MDKIRQFNKEKRKTKTLEEVFGKTYHKLKLQRYAAKALMGNDVSWIGQNEEQAKLNAINALVQYIDESLRIASLDNNIRDHIQAFKKIGITINKDEIDEIFEYKLNRLNEQDGDSQQTILTTVEQKKKINIENKHKQYNAMRRESNVKKMRSLLPTMTPMEFRTKVIAKFLEEKPFEREYYYTEGIPKVIFPYQDGNRSRIPASDKKTYAYQLFLNSFLCNGIVLGARGGHMILENIDTSFIVHPDHEGIFYNFYDYKKQLRPGQTYRSISRMVPSKTVETDPIIALALYLFYMEKVFKPVEYPFFTPWRTNNTNVLPTSRKTNAARGIAPGIAAFQHYIARGIPMVKILHLVRGVSSNLMEMQGISSHDKAKYHCRTMDIDSNHYTTPEAASESSIVPFIIAGRKDKYDKPHPIFDFVDQVPDELLSQNQRSTPAKTYLAKLAIAVVAADLAPKVYQDLLQFEHGLDGWKELVEAETLPKKRKYTELEETLMRENKVLKLQVQRLQTQNQLVASKQDLTLEQAVGQLMKSVKQHNFPQIAKDYFNSTLVQIIENTPGYDTKSGFARNLRRIKLIIAASQQDLGKMKLGGSWTGFAQKNLQHYSKEIKDWKNFKNKFLQN